MRSMRLLALAVICVGCGGSAKPTPAPPAPDPIPHTAGPACDVVADKLVIVVHADKPDAQATAKAQLRTRCTEDHWSDDARSCLATIENDSELDGCKQHFTDPQKKAFARLVPQADAWGSADDAAPTPAAAAAPADTMAPPKPKTKAHTRGAQPKGDSSDPQEGGE